MIYWRRRTSLTEWFLYLDSHISLVLHMRLLYTQSTSLLSHHSMKWYGTCSVFQEQGLLHMLKFNTRLMYTWPQPKQPAGELLQINTACSGARIPLGQFLPHSRPAESSRIAAASVIQPGIGPRHFVRDILHSKTYSRIRGTHDVRLSESQVFRSIARLSDLVREEESQIQLDPIIATAWICDAMKFFFHAVSP